MADREEPVVGYEFYVPFEAPENGMICRIVERAGVFDFGLGIEPSFVVEFADGTQREALSQQLRPWYPC